MRLLTKSPIVQLLLPNVIKIWYIKNDNYRLVIKNYGL